MSTVAVGTKVFTRTEKLQSLLDSVDPEFIDTVYIADDGKMTDEKKNIYQDTYEFELNIYDLEYDAGLGFGRKHIVDNMKEDYVLLVDTDHTIPNNVSTLKNILENDQSVGGVCGVLIENDQIRARVCDLYEEEDILIRDIDADKKVENIAGAPFAEFDYLANIALFRRECVESYTWDKNYVIGHEHLDFYVGHMKNTDWRFGICPSVHFRHHPGGDNSYTSNRRNRDKLEKSREYFLNKWGYSEVYLVTSSWYDSLDRGSVDPVDDIGRAIMILGRRAPPRVKKYITKIKSWYSSSNM